VIAAGFDEAARRDPDHQRTWVALVDGNNHQIDRSTTKARRRGVTVAIVVDFVHVLEYVWKAAWCFYPEGDPHAEQWVRTHARAVLAARAGIVAAAIRRKARGVPEAGCTQEQRGCGRRLWCAIACCRPVGGAGGLVVRLPDAAPRALLH